MLQTTFLHCTTSHLGKIIIDVILNIYKCDPANYFILESQQTLSTFLENLTDKNGDIQVCGQSEGETERLNEECEILFQINVILFS